MTAAYGLKRPSDDEHQASGWAMQDGEPRRIKLLFFFQGCFLRHTDGCHARVLQTLDLLKRCNVDVTLYSYANNRAWPWEAKHVAEFSGRYPGWRLVLEEDSWTRRTLGRARSALNTFLPMRSDAILRVAVPRMSPRLAELRKCDKFDYLLFNNADGLTQMNGLPTGRIIVDMHDFSALEGFQRGEVASWRTTFNLRKELCLLNVADIVWCISQAEYAVTREMLPEKRISFIPASAEILEELQTATGQEEFKLLFVGSNNRWNADALLRFLDSYETWRVRPKLAVAGRVCEDARVEDRARKSADIALLGFQEDLMHLYRKAAATICPVEGTGTKIKIIESLAARRPVFAAEGAMRGLAPGYECCVFPLKEENVRNTLYDGDAITKASRAALSYSIAHGTGRLMQTVLSDLQALTMI